MSLQAQDEQEIYYGKKYLDLNLRSLNKYTKRIERQQKQLLHKLKRKESKVARQLQKNDSAGYAQYLQQSLTYDSIGKLIKRDSSSFVSKTSRNKVIDSLKRVQVFLSNNSADINGYDSKLSNLQSQLDYRQYVNSLIDKRSRSLKNISTKNIPALSGLEKEIFYGKSKMKVWKQVADEPSKAEELALEYLQGSQGFSPHLTSPNGEGMANATSATDLEKMGFQTKRQLNEQLQKKFGNNLSNVQEKMSSEVSEWQQSVGNKQQSVGKLRSDIATKRSLRGAVSKPSPFGGAGGGYNPMRGLPFWKRIEKGYNFQTSRATPDGKRPAMLDLSATVAFKHTPKLKYGLGLATSIGLGQNWSNIRFTFEGIGARSFLQYEMFFGISAYTGYERFFKSTANYQPTTDNQLLLYNEHNTPTYREAALIGLTKSYNINSKWNGAIQLLYDVWWKDKGLNSPIVLRFATNSK